MDDFAYTSSGIPLQPVYGPADRRTEPPEPGRFPFTRGNFASGYRGRLWTLRQYSGFGTAGPLPVPARAGRHRAVGGA